MFVLDFCGWAMACFFVALEVLPVALRLMAWLGVRAGGASVPFFDVESTSVAVVPICKMFGSVGVWRSCLLAVGCCHLSVWWWDVAIRSVIASGRIGWWCITSSSTLGPVVSVASSCIASVAAPVVARLVVRLCVIRGGYVCRDVRWHVRLLGHLRLVVHGRHVVGWCEHGIGHPLQLLGVCKHRHLLC